LIFGVMGIRTKSLCGFMLILFMFAAPMGYSVFSGRQIRTCSSDLQDKIYPALNLTSQLIDSMRQTREHLLTAVSESDEDFIAQGIVTAERVRKNLRLLKRITADKKLETIEHLFEKYMEKAVLAAHASVNGSSLEDIRDTVASLNDTAGKLNQLTELYYKATYKTFAFNVQKINRLSSRFVYVILATFVMSTFIGGIVVGKHIVSTE